MKKCITIFVLLVYFFGTTEAYNFLKFPLLIEHFINHKKENPKLSIIGFLKVHYLMDHGRDSDYDHDMKLPFKSGNIGCCNSSVVTILPSPLEEVIKPIKIIPIKFSITNDNIPVFLYETSLFQPPRVNT